jgi:elongation factor 1-gamma
MPPTYTLYTPEASFRAFATLIAAEYNAVAVDVVTDATAEDAKSPVGKLPVLETPSGEKIFSCYAAARFIAGLRRDTGLTGNSPVEAASVDVWIDFAAQELELPACAWFYPVAGYMPFSKTSYEKSKVDLAKALQVLNEHLNGKAYLVGNQITLADIVVASTLLYPFKLVADPSYLKHFGNVLKWFTNCVSQEEFQQIVGQVTMCQKEIMAPGQS